MPRLWSEAEWDELFVAHPPRPTARPSWTDIRRLARRFERTPDALFSTWQSAEQYCRGAGYHRASPRLRQYLDARLELAGARDDVVNPD